MINKGLIDKFRRGACSPEELAALKAYFEQIDQSALEKLLEDEWNEAKNATEPPLAAQQRIWSRLERSTSTGLRVAKPNRRRVAAALLMLIIAGVASWWLNHRPDPGILVEQRNDENGPMEISLEDGSRVWLNRNSKIRFPKPFPKEIRELALEGEAFFEVQRAGTRPFIVKTGNIQTRVLGTSFNVRAIPGRGTIEIALVEGKVRVERDRSLGNAAETKELSPGQMLRIQRSDGQFRTHTYKGDAPFAWKNGIIHFDGAKIQEVIQVLENWYEVEFSVQEASRMSSELVHRFDAGRMTLDQVLNGIEKVTDYKFEKLDKKKILVKPD